jgi:ribosome biogenesis protein MAK21
MDTLFKITHSSNFNTSVQALMLIEQLATAKHLAVDRFYKTLYESLLDPRLITSSKHALYLNLLFRAVRSDVNIKRVKAFAKRMLQIITLHQPPFICGVLYLLSELKQTFPGLKSLFNDPEDDGQDDEVFRDVPEDGGPADQDDELPVKRSSDTYDGRKRDPEYSNADKSCVWESVSPSILGNYSIHANSSDRSHFLSISTPLSLCSLLDLFKTRRCRRSLT